MFLVLETSNQRVTYLGALRLELFLQLFGQFFVCLSDLLVLFVQLSLFLVQLLSQLLIVLLRMLVQFLLIFKFRPLGLCQLKRERRGFGVSSAK